MSRIAAALALLAVLAGPAHAYRLDEDGFGHVLHWAAGDRPVDWQLAFDVPGGGEGRAAVHRAAASWSGVTDRYGVRFAGEVAAVEHRVDGRNVVGWVWHGWPYDPALLATTARSFRTDNGRMVDADVLLNAESHAWGTGGGHGFDVESAIAHEFGHFAGLGHSDAGDATMYASTRGGDTRKRTLEDDDRAGLTALYGVGVSPGGSAQGIGAAPSVGSSGGGCAIGAGGEDPWEILLVVGLVVMAGMRSRRRMRRPGRAAHAAPADAPGRGPPAAFRPRGAGP